MSMWRKFTYWLRGKRAKFTPISLNDHFMSSYIKVVVAWVGKNSEFTV
jgi:hypothetical protein